MQRKNQVIAAIAVVVAILMGLGLAYLARQRSGASKLQDTLHSALTNPVEFAKSRLTGGVGLILRADSATGSPIVQGVGVGSPAETAGLRIGDLIIRIDGSPTQGKPLAQVVQDIRGFTGAKVTLTVQRAGSTNLDCVIPRSSWNNLRGINFKQ